MLGNGCAPPFPLGALSDPLSSASWDHQPTPHSRAAALGVCVSVCLSSCPAAAHPPMFHLSCKAPKGGGLVGASSALGAPVATSRPHPSPLRAESCSHINGLCPFWPLTQVTRFGSLYGKRDGPSCANDTSSGLTLALSWCPTGGGTEATGVTPLRGSGSVAITAGTASWRQAGRRTVVSILRASESRGKPGLTAAWWSVQHPEWGWHPHETSGLRRLNRGRV